MRTLTAFAHTLPMLTRHTWRPVRATQSNPQVSQIKTALAELERGNVAAFQMGKEARKVEKELAQKFKSDMKLTSQVGGASAIWTRSGDLGAIWAIWARFGTPRPTWG